MYESGVMGRCEAGEGSGIRVIALSGLPGSGTTTAARLVEKETGWEHVNTGGIFRGLAREMCMDLNEFGRYAMEHPEVDRELDRRQVELGHRGGVILEGRLSGHVLKNAGVRCLAVLLEAPLEVRVSRVAGRDGQPSKEALTVTLEREELERQRYIKTYGIDLNDRSVYDIIIDSSKHTPAQILVMIMERIK